MSQLLHSTNYILCSRRLIAYSAKINKNSIDIPHKMQIMMSCKDLPWMMIFNRIPLVEPKILTTYMSIEKIDSICYLGQYQNSESLASQLKLKIFFSCNYTSRRFISDEQWRLTNERMLVQRMPGSVADFLKVTEGGGYLACNY